MKFFTKKSTIQKIILALVVIILFNFAIPVQAQAEDTWEKIGGKILKELVKLVDSLGDVVMGLLNKTMLKTNEIYGSVMLDYDDAKESITNSDGIMHSDGTEQPRESVEFSKFSNGLLSDFKFPNMLYCPENIFANKIPAFDVNFIHPNSYTGVYGQQEKSYATKLAPTISSWYKAFRNISVVGLLCVLVYLGIRILIETSAQGKAKYKESLKNWFVALCLVFAIHFIMAGTLMLIDKVTELLTNSLGSSNIYIDLYGKTNTAIPFKTNLTGYVRLMAESNEWGNATAYSIIYVVLVIYTVMFTFTYFKRFLWMAFLTMIAPLVALTYPIDKAGDGKAQAFNMWFKEYIMNAILQPVHLLLYSVMVSSAISLAKDNPIYAVVAIGFLIPAEKFIKKMFGLDKGETAGGLGSFAGGAMTMKALESLGKKAPPPIGKGGPGKGQGQQESSDSQNYRIRQNKRNTLEGFKGEENNFGIGQAKEDKAALLGAAAAADKVTEDDSVSYSNVDKGLDDKALKQNNEKIEETNKNSMQDKETAMTNNAFGNSRREALKNTTKKAIKKGVKKLPSGFKYTAKKTLRGAAKGAGLIMGGTIGLAAGIASGDASKAFQYGLAGGTAGNKIGEGLYNGSERLGRGAINLGDKAVKTINSTKNSYREERYGLAGARQKEIEEQNKKAKKAFIKDEEEKRKYKEIAAKLEEKNGKEYDVDDLMSSAFDYKVAGLDDKQIETGLKLEDKYGGIGGENHEQIMDIVGFAGNYSKSDMLDDKERANMKKDVASIVKGKEQQEQVMNLVAESYGLGNFYSENEKNSKAKTSKIITGKDAEKTFDEGRKKGTIILGG